MKNLLKKIWYSILILFALLCGFVFFCAFNPDVTQRLGELLYWDASSNSVEGGNTLNGSNEGVTNGQLTESGGNSDSGTSDNNSGVATNLHSDYVIPEKPVETPTEVAGRSGYEPIQSVEEEVTEGDISTDVEEPGTSETGEGLTFDPTMYPYYAMLDETGQALYRQIYANANVLTEAFSPVVDCTVSQLKNVFTAVYNDHPELFWLDTSYSCKYRQDGSCVEIGLVFNQSAMNLDIAKNEWNKAANSILQNARTLGSSYEKELYVHDALIEQVEYNLQTNMNQSAYSALVNDSTVCAGYARAFQYLLQQLGIPCYYCTGYAGESHAWNIVKLGDDYYNVDPTWADTNPASYDYFNKTDQDYAGNHVRQDLSVYLPACNGETYRNIVKEEERGLRSLEQTGFIESDVLTSLGDYYVDCYNQLIEAGIGNYEFSNVIDSEALLQEIYNAYDTNSYENGYMTRALQEMEAASCKMNVEVEALKSGYYLITHSVRIK